MAPLGLIHGSDVGKKNRQLPLTCLLTDLRYAFDWKNMTMSGKQSLMSRSYKALLVFYGDSHSDLRRAPVNASDSVICFQIAYHVAVLLVHRPFLGDADGSQTRILALRGATAAAMAICRILREYRRKCPLSSLPPQVMNYVVCAAVIHLLNATSGRTGLGRRSAGNLKICMDTLVAVGERWDARKNTSIRFIRKLAHKWKVVWALPLQFSAPLEESEPVSGMESDTEKEDGHDARCIPQPREASLFAFPDTLEFPFDHLNTFPEEDDISALDWLYAGQFHDNETISPVAAPINSMDHNN